MLSFWLTYPVFALLLLCSAVGNFANVQKCKNENFLTLNLYSLILYGVLLTSENVNQCHLARKKLHSINLVEQVKELF